MAYTKCTQSWYGKVNISSRASQCILCVYTCQHPGPWRGLHLPQHCRWHIAAGLSRNSNFKALAGSACGLWWVVAWRVGDLQALPNQTRIAQLLLCMWRVFLNYTESTLSSVHVWHSWRWGARPRTQEYRLQRCPQAALLNPHAQLQHTGWWEHLFFFLSLPFLLSSELSPHV